MIQCSQNHLELHRLIEVFYCSKDIGKKDYSGTSLITTQLGQIEVS